MGGGVGVAGDGAPASLRPTYVEVDLDACAANLRRIRALVRGRDVWAVVKADAYGHGAVPVARTLVAEGVAGLAVATVEEAVELRLAGIGAPVLILAGVEPLTRAAAEAVARHRLAVAVWDRRTAAALGRVAAARGGGPVAVHLKVDTGMGRLGVRPGEAVEVARALSRTPGVRLEGVFSNLSAADHHREGEAGRAHTALQARRFARVCRALEAAGCLPPQRHLANSAALGHHRPTWEAPWCTGVRPGLALYGASLTESPGLLAGLRPALSWWTSVAAVRQLPAGWPVGYGLSCRTRRRTRLAVLPVGYHDGWPRAVGGRAQVLIRGRRVPVAGAISMDVTLADITDLPGAGVGDPVALVGRWPGEGGAAIAVEELAAWAGSIPHEILCRIGSRVPRRYRGGAPAAGAAGGRAEAER